uniref:Uncharacterized protein n=1 Tax=Timema cristinae TaxID=61476 RepID=A0A7R9GR88_TIMCR|nr:unnamed protein product [Timema cristinae]
MGQTKRIITVKKRAAEGDDLQVRKKSAMERSVIEVALRPEISMSLEPAASSSAPVGSHSSRVLFDIAKGNEIFESERKREKILPQFEAYVYEVLRTRNLTDFSALFTYPISQNLPITAALQEINFMYGHSPIPQELLQPSVGEHLKRLV